MNFTNHWKLEISGEYFSLNKWKKLQQLAEWLENYVAQGKMWVLTGLPRTYHSYVYVRPMNSDYMITIYSIFLYLSVLSLIS